MMTISDFEHQLRLNYSSENTIKTYHKQVERFLKFCNGNVCQEKLDEYLLNQRKENSTSNYSLFINAMQRYCEFANIELKFPKQKTPKQKESPYWTEKELKNILRYTPMMFKNFQMNDMILKTMFYTGMRPQEIINIKESDIDFTKEYIRVVKGKGEKDRVIPFPDDKFMKELKTYTKNNKGEKLFNINKTKLSYIFKKIKEGMSFDYDVSPYILRRSFAKYCLEKGVDISFLQMAMGHSDIKMTLRYAKPDQRMLMEVFQKIKKGE